MAAGLGGPASRVSKIQPILLLIIIRICGLLSFRLIDTTQRPKAMYVCICKQVTDRQIKTAIENGATSMRDLRNELDIANQCGQCGRCAKAMLKEHAQTPREAFPLFSKIMFAAD